MAEMYPWAEALAIQPEQLKEWSESLPEGQSLLVWCLENGKIDEDQYLSWASETFELPRLKREFFSALPTPPQRLRQILENNQMWSQHCFPLHEWEGVLFIGCNQKVPEFPAPQPMTFVLAPPSELTKLWFRLHADTTQIHARVASAPQESKSAPEEEKLAPVIPLPVAPPESAHPKGATLSIEDLLGSAPEPEAITEDAPAESEAPEGLALAPQTSSNEMPEGLALTLAMPEPSPEPATMTVLAPEAPAPPQSVESPSSSDPRDAVLLKMVPPFEQAMILTFTDGELRAHKWTAGWQPNAQSKNPISLNEPSIFKIAAETLLPYHGYVVGNPTNDAFFSAWNDKKLPQHVTLMPVVVSKKLVAMLLGVISDGSPSNSLLHLMEKLSAEYAQQKPKVA